MQVNIYFAFIVFLILYILFPILTLVIFFNDKRKLKIIGLISFIVFCRVRLTKEFLYIDFNNYSAWFSSYFIWADFGKLNILYNLVMLLPVSIFVMSQTEKNVLLKTILFSFLISITIETLQFILPITRNTELFDIVTNTASGILGYLLFKPIYIIVKKARQKN